MQHERVVLLTVKTLQLPHVEPKDRMSIEPLSQEFYRFIINYGFMEDPDIPNGLENLELRHGLVFEMSETTFFLGRETVIAGKHPGMMIWREKLFAFMSATPRARRLLLSAADRVVELGSQIEM